MGVVKVARILSEDDVVVVLEVKKDALQPRWYPWGEPLYRVAFVGEHNGHMVLCDPWPHEEAEN